MQKAAETGTIRNQNQRNLRFGLALELRFQPFCKPEEKKPERITFFSV